VLGFPGSREQEGLGWLAGWFCRLVPGISVGALVPGALFQEKEFGYVSNC